MYCYRKVSESKGTSAASANLGLMTGLAQRTVFAPGVWERENAGAGEEDGKREETVELPADFGHSVTQRIPPALR